MTQNHSRWVLALAWTPNATLLRHLTQNWCKAYIPLRRKTIRVGYCNGLDPQRHTFVSPVGICWYILALPNAKICVIPAPNLKFALPQTPTPDASQWKIGGVGDQMQNSCIGHVHFMFFVLISFAFGAQRKPSFHWNYGLNCSRYCHCKICNESYCTHTM